MPPGSSPSGTSVPDELLGDGAHRSVPPEGAHQPGALLDRGPGLTEAGVVLGRLDEPRLGHAGLAGGRGQGVADLLEVDLGRVHDDDDLRVLLHDASSRQTRA